MFRKKSKRSRTRLLRRKQKLLLLLVTASLVLTALISCTSTEPVTVETTKNEILVNLIPDLPELPAFPELHWTYNEGLYCISESDVDRLLDYAENKLPIYRYEMELYGKQLDVILEALK